ncbi:O-antigen ligase family protein [Ancylobacter sp. WKF20]|uniref:O-antigen ligase family protein n=1 Tax=Ancylobacter sp. WKF20 TaxID=3039801 RepID=UPI0024343388|nr:O-antigen ligase family protein [Ancylobacter sp. WKF20]WGD31624.1 O-antigen ligase family protein [Ancylobacter sp. WKF20]
MKAATAMRAVRANRDDPRFLRRADGVESLNDLIFVVFLVTLAWLPLAFGSNRPIAWATNAILFGSMLAVIELGFLLGDRPRPVALRRLGWALGVFAAVAGWIVVQTLPGLPLSWRSDFWQIAADVLTSVPGAPPVHGSISTTPDAGLVALLRLATTAAAFYLAVQLCRDGLRARLFALGLVGIIAVYALYGIIQLIAFPEQLLWGPKFAYPGAVTSTFINRNSFATYANVGLVVALALVFDSLQGDGVSRHLPFALRLSELMARVVRQALPLMVPLLVIAIALLWTLSRAGLLCGIFGVVTLIALYGVSGRRSVAHGIAGLLVALGFVALVLAYGEGTVERVDTADGLDTRLSVALQTLEAARDVPVTGFGYGSFADVYPVYRSDRFLNSFWTKAHDTYVELAFELGFPATLALLALGAGVLVVMMRNIARRERRPLLSLAALAASVAALTHSLVDFSLQIQAVGVTFWALLGAGLTQSWSRRIDTSR